MSDKYWHLKNCGLFERLPPDAIRQLEQRSRSRVLARATPVYLPADAADGVLLLVSGRVKICHLTPEGKQSILAFIEPGELFGELALVDNTARDDYAEAVEKSEVVLLPADAIQNVMQHHPEVSLGITKLIGLRRRRIERRLKNLLFRSNRERLVHLLLELAEHYGVSRGSAVELSIKLSHQELASVIGSTRETVTVLLGELQDEGLLEVARRRIKILRLDALAESVLETPPDLPTVPPRDTQQATFG